MGHPLLSLDGGALSLPAALGVVHADDVARAARSPSARCVPAAPMC